LFIVFFFEAEDGIRDDLVTGVQTCALPISHDLVVYYPKLRALCDKYGILLVDDEVMSGFARTGKWLAMQHYGIRPDIVTCAKGLTSGYLPLGAVIVSDAIAQHFETNMLWGGLTYSGHPVCCAAAIPKLHI